ncbi:DNA-3-methyladenine glycosylase I [Desulfosporosinus meridiei]|uniref:3-methyladenine DNA glycosylase n=1 Tax=Desulfosporosinus meridiei (strain ATCC BAA-275 / DSM 13257 / KCTC 12902 / NCIMB 13706 / S10) TaxID=768704 RepID=J7IYP0_DESMD|nr:DNA-3-methyladenine glycosylase I [Desulfosporosinus meridiei]AFQ44213.1 3-methyladenine DNA glycosylase [Desulfosporosinus meridiei DSM 13257]
MSACLWPGNNPMMQLYHDQEWCRPSHDDSYLFEMLTLEGAQSGLSWNIVLSKREEYKRAFRNFDIVYCSKLSDEELEGIRTQYNVIKHQLKLKSVRSNALAVLKIQLEFGSFSNFLWRYTDFKPIINHWELDGQIPAQTSLSEQISKDLKRRSFKFVGSVTVYSFMQAIGMVDDHVRSCLHHTNNR